MEFMTNEEMLMFAAKAAGIKIDFKYSSPPHAPAFLENHQLVILNDAGGHGTWAPLTDDADAFRLAVKLGMTLHLNKGLIFCHLSDLMQQIHELEVHDVASVRRSIVQAAAEIGKRL